MTPRNVKIVQLVSSSQSQPILQLIIEYLVRIWCYKPAANHGEGCTASDHRHTEMYISDYEDPISLSMRLHKLLLFLCRTLARYTSACTCTLYLALMKATFMFSCELYSVGK